MDVHTVSCFIIIETSSGMSHENVVDVNIYLIATFAFF